MTTSAPSAWSRCCRTAQRSRRPGRLPGLVLAAAGASGGLHRDAAVAGRHSVTAGFIGKFYIVAAGASSAMWPLIVILVVTSAIGLFYYLRIIVVMYGQPSESLG